MKYYILDVKAEPIFPQLNCISQEHAHRLQHGEFPNFVPKLVFRFEKGVKHTDILSQASINASGFLINEKVKNIFERFNLIDHKFFNASIINDNTEHYWIHFVADLKKIDWINYPNSTFYITEFGFKEGDLQIESYEDLLQKSKEVGEMGTVEIDQITLNSNFDNSLDLFIIPFLTPKVFISLRLKQALEKDTTGIEINEAQIVLL